MRFLLKLSLTALTFIFILPHIGGITFHGGFGTALLVSLLFGFMLWLVDLAAIAISAMLTITSFGMALLWLIPMWVLGYWLLPCIALKLVSTLAPQALTIVGWTPAILAGLAMMIIGGVTSKLIGKKKD
ncbi:MAG TPA: hypothetical protein PKN86_01335 [Candidatus Obscuribacter sp.]|nr:hypothetical protein [Candidatus Obscuribacter sp.]MBK9277199.1 hypothetical protein [Candidatus Obscuribacter sp.]HMW91635.1 hypothetical protein [Candidatus Obscuribacter sp.]HMY51512.1 hypothetical protein [Candidatus Obscuribacter sp.]HNA72276.1 hypothetical protein [Candidatus Obscuribacter sp.]